MEDSARAASGGRRGCGRLRQRLPRQGASFTLDGRDDEEQQVRWGCFIQASHTCWEHVNRSYTLFFGAAWRGWMLFLRGQWQDSTAPLFRAFTTKYSSRPYHVPSIIPGTGDRAAKNTKSECHRNYILVGETGDKIELKHIVCNAGTFI